MSDKKIKLLTIIAAVFGPLLGFILILFDVPDNVVDFLPVIAIIMLFCIMAMFTFFAWRQRKIATIEEKHLSYTSILSMVLVATMMMNQYILHSVVNSSLLILFGIIVLICWNWYMRRNPDLSNQKFHLIYLLSLLNIMMGCYSLVFISYVNFNIKMILFGFAFFGIFVLYAFQDRIFRYMSGN